MSNNVEEELLLMQKTIGEFYFKYGLFKTIFYVEFKRHLLIFYFLIASFIIAFLFLYFKKMDIFFVLLGLILSLFYATFLIQPINKYDKEINNIELTSQIIFYTAYFPYKFYEIVFNLCSDEVGMPTPDEIYVSYPLKQGLELMQKALIAKKINSSIALEKASLRLREILKKDRDIRHFSKYSTERVVEPLKAIPYDYEITSFLPIIIKIDKTLQTLNDLLVKIVNKDESNKNINEEATFIPKVHEFKNNYDELIEKYEKSKIIGYIQKYNIKN